MGMIYEWVRARAGETPDRNAITLYDRNLTFGEIESQSNRLAGLLIRSGLRKGDRVALLLEKTPEAIVAMHGVGKAGGIYIPIDIHSPVSRIAKILRTADARLLMVDEAALRLLRRLDTEEPGSAPRARIRWDDQELPEEDDPAAWIFQYKDLLTERDRPYSASSDPFAIAHILFTSGSTGDPKGVPVTHRSIHTFVEWAVGYFGMGPGDRTSCHAPLHFDLSTFDIYGSLAAGSHLFLVPAELSLSPKKLSRFIGKNRLTQWFSVPSVLSYMSRFQAIPPEGYPDLRRLIWCGEVFPVSSLRYWMKALPEVQFTNLYGPTEATIASSYHTLSSIPEEGEEVPIGRPCLGEEFHVLDEERSVVPPGKKGDLYISGKGLSPGYFRDPDKTRVSFHSWLAPDGMRVRIYKTGDVASVNEKGNFYYHGRTDHQIKSRGYRIELGEIENALDELESLREFAVVPVRANGFEGTSIGCAYVTRGKGLGPAQIRKELSAKIPGYMIPQLWRSWSVLPRNGNGKIDRKALSEVFGKGEATNGGGANGGGARGNKQKMQGEPGRTKPVATAGAERACAASKKPDLP